jgi:hypothetical protein
MAHLRSAQHNTETTGEWIFMSGKDWPKSENDIFHMGYLILYRSGIHVLTHEYWV